MTVTSSIDAEDLLSKRSGTSSWSWNSPVVKEIPVPIPSGNFWADFVESYLFRNLSLVLILVNALWIGADTEWNHVQLLRNDKLPLEPESVIVEIAFCVLFTLELVVRWLSYDSKFGCFRDAWFDFDALLLVFMWIDGGVLLAEVSASSRDSSGSGALGPISLLRLLRLTRLVRLMRFFPELMTLVKGMCRAMESVFYVLVFMMMMIYSTSIVFTIQLGCPPAECPPELMEESEDPTALDLFGDIGSSMMTLLTNGVLADNLFQTLMAIKAESMTMMLIFLVFVLVSGITLLNMLIGVLCKVVQDTAQSEDERKKASDLRDILCKAFKEIDVSNDGYIEEQEWSGIQRHPEVRRSMYKLGVDEGELDVRLTQLRAKVFWDRPGRLTRRSTEESRLTRRSTTSSMATRSSTGDEIQENQGLDFDAFMEQVSDLDWNKKASALEVETFKSDFLKETTMTRRMLDDLEEHLEELLERRGIQCGESKRSQSRKNSRKNTRTASFSPVRKGLASLRPPVRAHTPPSTIPGALPLPPAPPPQPPPAHLQEPPELPLIRPKGRLEPPSPPLVAPPPLDTQEEPRLPRSRSPSLSLSNKGEPQGDPEPEAPRRNTISGFSDNAEEFLRQAAQGTPKGVAEGQHRLGLGRTKPPCAPKSIHERLAAVPTDTLLESLRVRLQRKKGLQRKGTMD